MTKDKSSSSDAGTPSSQAKGSRSEPIGERGQPASAAKDAAVALLKEYELRFKEYRIAEFNWGQKKSGKVIPAQVEAVQAFIERLRMPQDVRKKYFLYQGGNGAGKSALGAFLTSCMAIPDSMKKKLGLPMVGKKKEIFVGTQSGANVKDVIEPYLLGEGSIARIPPILIEKVHRDNTIVKTIYLKDGTRITIGTYDAGREVLQGKNPDFVWLDEEAKDAGIWTEALMRTRTIGQDGDACPILITMTPLFGPGTPILEFFHEQRDAVTKSKQMSWLVDSRDNKFTDTSIASAVSGQEFQQRILGVATSPTGLVYHAFDRRKHVVPHFDPKELGPGTKFYAGVDLGMSHPTGIVGVAVDTDGNNYVFKDWKKQDASLEEIAEVLNGLDSEYGLEWIVRDSAARREGAELLRLYGVKTIPADKHSKGANGESNRRTGILLVNQMLNDGKLIVSDRCRALVKEIENHYYLDSSRDGQVNKEEDDVIDGLRYYCTMIRSKVNTKEERDFKARHGLSWKRAKKSYNTGEQPY